MEKNQLLKTTILVIEDDTAMADLICYSLKKDGFIAECVDTGNDGLERLKTNVLPDLVILDITLPDISGLDICKEIMSKYSLPVIMITARDNIIDKVRGFESGADDYITKPFDLIELMVRIRAVIRRTKTTNRQNEIYISQTLLVNVNERKAYRNKELVDLTPREFDLLLFLVNNKGRVLSRQQIMDSVWGFDFYGDTRTVDNHIKMLRKKLDDNLEVSFIETVYKIGYLIPK